MPATGCRLTPPNGSALKLRNDATDTKDQLKWRWSKGAFTDVSAFKNPVSGTATYRLCLYDATPGPQPRMNRDIPAGGTPAGATCATKPCWRAIGVSGFAYRDKDATPDGITGLKLKAGITGKAKLQAKGKGLLLSPPPLPIILPATMQLVISDGVTTECWSATYAISDVNDGVKFSAKGP